MATFLHDTFTLSGAEVAGESLAAHTGEIGAHWTNQQGNTTNGDAVVDAGGQLRLGGTSASYWYTQYVASGVPVVADYTVQADLILASAPSADYSWGVLGRLTGSTTYYQFWYDTRQSGWVLLKSVAGAQTTLGTHAAAFSAGAQHTIQLVMTGQQISAVLDGATVIGPVADSAISAAGAAGAVVYLNPFTPGTFTPGDALGPQIDNVYGIDTSAALSVTLSPTSATLAPGASQQFSATVVGSANQNVTWSVQEGASGGTISSGGLYTAPLGLGTYHVVATAAADGATTGVATVVVYAPVPPGTPSITLATAAGLDTVSVSAAPPLGSSAIAGYRLYAGTASGFETYTGTTITPSAFPAAFPSQPTAAAGAAKYYYVRAIDTAGLLSAPSPECWSRTTGLVASGTAAARVFVAPYGAAASGLAASLGYTVYDYEGAVLVPHTLGQTYEVGAGGGTPTGIYAALVSIDTAYEGVLVWDAPAGSGPYIEAFDAGSLAQVSGYASGLDPASQILAHPLNKIQTNSSGQVQQDLGQAVPTSNTAQTVGDALNAARACGFGKWALVGTTLQLFAPDGTTVVRTFTLDSALAPTQRT